MLFQQGCRQGDRSRIWGTTIPESVYMTFQMTFAIITPALICGAFADRMKFSAMLWFMRSLVASLIYSPIAHMMWEPSGVLGRQPGVLDFAGGTVVHINAGIAGLVCALVLGKRIGYGKESMAPHNLTLTLIGASLLWVGWFGFNAGSARRGRRPRRHGDDRHAARHRSRRARRGCSPSGWPRASRRCSASRRAPSPAWSRSRRRPASSASPGRSSSASPPACSASSRRRPSSRCCGYDDSLDAFGVHCIGGIVGALLTGVFNVKEISGADASMSWRSAARSAPRWRVSRRRQLHHPQGHRHGRSVCASPKKKSAKVSMSVFTASEWSRSTASLLEFLLSGYSGRPHAPRFFGRRSAIFGIRRYNRAAMSRDALLDTCPAAARWPPMISLEYCQLLARYNRWMNERLYAPCADMPDDERKRDRGAFFGSIHRTLNHMLWGDRIWLGRFTGTAVQASARIGADMYAEFRRSETRARSSPTRDPRLGGQPHARVADVDARVRESGRRQDCARLPAWSRRCICSSTPRIIADS